jgi:hypothetical protein
MVLQRHPQISFKTIVLRADTVPMGASFSLTIKVANV